MAHYASRASTPSSIRSGAQSERKSIQFSCTTERGAGSTTTRRRVTKPLPNSRGTRTLNSSTRICTVTAGAANLNLRGRHLDLCRHTCVRLPRGRRRARAVGASMNAKIIFPAVRVQDARDDHIDGLANLSAARCRRRPWSRRPGWWTPSLSSLPSLRMNTFIISPGSARPVFRELARLVTAAEPGRRARATLSG